MSKETIKKVVIVAKDSQDYNSLKSRMDTFNLCYDLYGIGSVIVSGLGSDTTLIEPYNTRGNTMYSPSTITKVEEKRGKNADLVSKISECNLNRGEIHITINDFIGSKFYTVFF